MTTSVLQRTPTQRWTLDPNRSRAEFSVRTYWGLATVKGHFDRIEGAYVVDDDGPRMQLTIDAASLDTGNRTRDRHLRSIHFFDVDANPQVRFTSDSVFEHGDGELTVTGHLEAGGHRMPLTLTARVEQHGGELEIETTTTVDHRELGMTYSPLGMIRPPATLHVDVRLRPEP